MKRPGPHVNYIMPAILLIAMIAALLGNCVLDRMRNIRSDSAVAQKRTLVAQTPVPVRAIASPTERVKPTSTLSPAVPPSSHNLTTDSPTPTPAYSPYPAYIEVFKGLETKDWYYHQYNASLTREHKYNDHRKRGFDPDDIHAFPLLRLRKGHRLTFESASALVNINKSIAEILADSDVFQIAFMKGERFPIGDLKEMPLDTPVCIIKLHKKNTRYLAFESFTVESANIIEPLYGIRGVQILSTPDPIHRIDQPVGYLTTSVECLVRESDRSLELYKKLSLIHLSVTLGLHCEIFKR